MFIGYRYSRFILFLAVIAAVLAGCGSPESSDQGQVPLRPGLPPSPDSAAGLEYDAPEGWVEEPTSSSMRLAQFRLPRAEGDAEDAELVIFHFGGGGGSVRANIDRWVGQFSNADGSPVGEAEVSEMDRNGIHLSVVDVSGTYNEARGPMMAQTTAKPNYRMLAAVAEGSGGPWFFKLTGPKSTVDHWEESFYAFLDTVRAG